MNRFQKLFSTHAHVFIPYMMLGYPDVETSYQLLIALCEAGADALELGLPFSDPVADGATLQAATKITLANGMEFSHAVALINKIREKYAIPICVMGYYNTIAPSQKRSALKIAGVDAVLCVDLPPSTDVNYTAQLEKLNLDSVYLVAPNSSIERCEIICHTSTAFVYVVNGYGTTGARDQINPATIKKLTQLRAITTKPLVTGFGISNAEQMKTLFAAGSDGVIIASKLIDEISHHPSAKMPDKLYHLALQLKQQGVLSC